MKKLFFFLSIALVSCNNVISDENESTPQDSTMADTTSNERKLNDIINENQEAGDSIKNVENMEPQMKDSPEQ